jgi:N-terminal domain of anti-restriction factor ArdC
MATSIAVQSSGDSPENHAKIAGKSHSSVYDIVTERILMELESGVVPWRKPWRTLPPANLVSKKPYRGINTFLLGLAGYGSQYWLTYRQAQALGGNVRKGEHGTKIVFWKFDKLHESGREPSIFEIAVEVRRALCGFKQQPRFSLRILPQVLCDIRVQIDFPLGGIGLQVFHDFRTILSDLLLDLDGAATIDDVSRFKTKSLRNSHPGRGKQDKLLVQLKPWRKDCSWFFSTEHRTHWTQHTVNPFGLLVWKCQTTV